MSHIRTIKKLAIQIYESLHSAAAEDFISSILSATLNESAEFKKQFICEWGGLHRNFSGEGFYAKANDPLPKCFRGRKSKKSKFKKRYLYPDILIWDERQNDDWDDVYGLKNKSSNKIDPLNAIFVEVKWDTVSDEDCEKFLEFLDKIERPPSLKFVLIMNLYDNKIEYITNNESNCVRYKKYENLHKLFNDERIKVVSFQEIYEFLCSIEKDISKMYSARLAKEYLSIFVDPATLLSWEYYYPKEKRDHRIKVELRNDLVAEIFNLGIKSGFLFQQRRPSVNNEDANTLRFVESRSNPTFRFENIKRPSEMLIVSIPGTKNIIFDLTQDSPREISNKLNKCHSAFENIFN